MLCDLTIPKPLPFAVLSPFHEFNAIYKHEITLYLDLGKQCSSVRAKNKAVLASKNWQVI